VNERQWNSIEAEEEPKWLAVEKSIFEEDNQNLGVCPSCHIGLLRYYFVGGSSKKDANIGSFWIWCPHCLRYDHLTCKVPIWWQSTGNIPLSLLDPEPNWFEDNWSLISQRESPKDR